MHILRSDELLRIHEAVLERFGGLQPKGAASEAERGKAESLVGSIRTAMTYNTAYNWNNVYLCAAMHAQCIARAHAFSDGNKRTALNAAGLLLRRAGCRLKDSEKLPFLLVELAQSDLPVTDAAGRLKKLMTESDDAANMEEPMNELGYFRIPPESLALLRDFAQERSPVPTLCISGIGSRWLGLDRAAVASRVVVKLLKLRHPDWVVAASDCDSGGFWKDKALREHAVQSTLDAIKAADLLILRRIWPYFHGLPDVRSKVMQALENRALAGKRTIVEETVPIAQIFARQNQPVPAFFQNALIVHITDER